MLCNIYCCCNETRQEDQGSSRGLARELFYWFQLLGKSACVCESGCVACAWSTCRQAADVQTGVVYSWGFSVMRIYKSDWFRDTALVSNTSSNLGLVEFYLNAIVSLCKNEVASLTVWC